jgi:hypothetical protein
MQNQVLFPLCEEMEFDSAMNRSNKCLGDSELCHTDDVLRFISK